MENAERNYVQYKEKFLARQAVKKALKSGDLIRPEICELCDAHCFTQAHHVDYTKPLVVFWLCDACHGVVHRKGSLLSPIKTDPKERWTGKESVTVSTSLPVHLFIFLKKLSETHKIPIAKLIRIAVTREYSLPKNSPEFKCEGLDDHYKELCPRESIQDVAKDEGAMLQSKSQQLQRLRGQRPSCLPGMERFFPKVCG